MDTVAVAEEPKVESAQKFAIFIKPVSLKPEVAHIDTGQPSSATDSSTCDPDTSSAGKDVTVSDTSTTIKRVSDDNKSSSDSPGSAAVAAAGSAAAEQDSVVSEYDAKNVHYDGEVAIYTEPKSGYQYRWCAESSRWLPRGGMTYGYEDDTHTYTDTEGAKYFWDVGRRAWFPKIDDDFMARYQMSYGFVETPTAVAAVDEEEEKADDSEASEEVTAAVEAEEDATQEVDGTKAPTKVAAVKRKAEVTPASWFEMNDQQNTKVYVSNLPTDISEEEFVDLMQKYGLVMRDVQTGRMKVKLYTVPDTDILKGDGLCTYIKIESVELALKLLDGYLYRGKRLKVERARFEMKGAYDPSLKPKKRKRKDKDKLKRMQEKLFDWRPEKMRGERSKHERVVIVKNLFEPTLFDREVSLILEYQQDLRDECGKCGEVKRVVLYDRHPEGVAQISMKEPEEADEVVTLLNGRWFGQRKLTAQIWDGKTKFKIAETDAQISKRIDNWEKFLDEEDAERKAEAAKMQKAAATTVDDGPVDVVV